MPMELIRDVIDWYMQNISYLTVFLLMMIEGSFVPMPSELVIPPAAYLAAKGEMNIVLVILAGTFGALAGALINYGLSYSLGRKIIHTLADTKLAHLLLITREKIEKAEDFFNRNGKSSTFFGRLVPGVRQLISIPAGLAKMRLSPFILWTFIGAGLWNMVLALLGYFFYSQKELLEMYYHELTIAVLILGGVFTIWLIIKMIRNKRRNARSGVE